MSCWFERDDYIECLHHTREKMILAVIAEQDAKNKAKAKAEAAKAAGK